VPVNFSRRFSQAISEGEAISLVALVEAAEAAARVETQGADALVVSPALSDVIEPIRSVTTLPVAAQWVGDPPPDFAGDACILPVDSDREWLERVHAELRGSVEIAFWVEDEEHLAVALEDFDPEIFILAAPDLAGEEALEKILDLLPDVPAGKLAIAELPESDAEDVAALERAGVDGVIVDGDRIAALADTPPPDV
jgi:NAD(P)H-dependent flavin oxidoreductase YrpB (nitropropane dioxygenase family)